MSDWRVYILCCADGSLYTGITNNIDRRLAEHNHDDRMAASYTRSRRPVELVYEEVQPDRSAAAKREAEIKQMSRREKAELIKRCS